MIYGAILEHHGFDVVVTDRFEGLDEHTWAALDAIIIDPGACASADVDAIREAASRHKVPSIALTYRFAPEELTALSTAGFDAVLLRPLAPDELVMCVRRLLPHGDARGATPST